MTAVAGTVRDHASEAAVVSGRTAGFLFAAAGLYTFVTVLLPTPPGFRHGWVLAVAVVAIAVGLTLPKLPWGRVPTPFRLALAPAGMALIAVHNLVSGMDPYRYGMFFFLVFLWFGVCEKRWLSVKMSPLILLAYGGPLVWQGASAADVASLSYAVPLYVTVGEVLAWRTARVRNLQRGLQRLVERDQLTGLCNRGAFTDALRARCDAGDEVAVVFIDLDGFKGINDRYGHQAGDEVLVRVADALRTSVRDGRDDLPCRLAGDEFVVLVHGPDALDAAQHVAERVAEQLRAVSGPDGQGILVSVGVAGGRGPAPDALVRAADEAMYAAKRGGGGAVAVSRCPQDPARPAAGLPGPLHGATAA